MDSKQDFLRQLHRSSRELRILERASCRTTRKKKMRDHRLPQTSRGPDALLRQVLKAKKARPLTRGDVEETERIRC